MLQLQNILANLDTQNSGNLPYVHQHVCGTNLGVEDTIPVVLQFARTPLWFFLEVNTSYHQKIDGRRQYAEQFGVLHSVPFGFYYYLHVRVVKKNVLWEQQSDGWTTVLICENIAVLSLEVEQQLLMHI